MSLKNEKFYHNEILVFAVLFAFSGICLIYAISNLSISFYEAEILYLQSGILSKIANFSLWAFGQNDYALRLPFLFLHFINCILLFKVSKFYLKRRFDRVLSVILYMLLPGVIASAILVNFAGILIFFTLLAVYFTEKSWKFSLYILLFILAFIDRSFYILYFCFFIFAIYYKKPFLAIFCAILFGFMIAFYDLGFEGKPKDYFLDSFGVFAATFSPFVFLFFIYTIYRIWLKDRKTILFFIVTATFCVSILLSIRQRLELEILLPYCVIATPLIIRAFFNSYRVRLPKFRKPHKFFAILTIFVLLFNCGAIIFNGVLYPLFFENKPKRHFIYKYDIAKELANSLKNLGISCVKIENELGLRLKFYGISKCENVEILDKKPENFKTELKISKYGVIIAKFYVKINE